MPGPPGERPPAFGYVPELDGIRGLAVLVVVAFHAGLAGFGGGFLGVDVFFVLSGYLITSLLLREQATRGRISLGRFYARRALRLLPALAVVIGACLAYALLVGGRLAPGTRLGALTSLAYVSNWFLATGRHDLGLLSHTWSLSIEEQFYLLVAPVVAVLVAARLRAWALGAGLAAVAAGVAVSRAARWHGPRSLLRLYYGFDSRADALLIGCALAAACAAGLVPRERWQRRAVQAASAGALAWLAVLVARSRGLEPFYFRGGFTLVAALTAVTLYQAVHAPLPGLSHALRLRPLVLLGRMSYGVYLWHYVALRALFPATGLPGPGWASPRRTLAGLALTVALAAASFVWVERPFLRLKDRLGGLRRPLTADLLSPARPLVIGDG